MLLMTALAVGCNTSEVAEEADPDVENAPPETEAATTTDEVETGTGTLQLVANGEDFVRQGFTTKDGWDITFDRVLVTLANVEAHQTEPPYDPDSDDELQAIETITLVAAPETIDLAAGDAEAEPILVSEEDVPGGQYNALSWDVVVAESGEAEGAAIALFGQASKDGRTLDFALRLDEPLSYTCGEFVGDERKGIVKADANANVEATLHFDHIFGDAELAADDELNAGALGFEPLAALAEGDTVEADSARLAAELDAAAYEQLTAAIASLGHVGEGHCKLN
ncbi:MAG: DUF4382 domain-containing protein [Spirulinaceae cyanobacterium SM2_1_0]|nr:DUF4382 domain-containing protein [Spirulinaceae cyanobacterium SM2_1_0]